MSARVPSAVLSDALSEAIAGRRVRAAVFTTYSFDPAFFEQHVLPLLFDRPFSQVEKVLQIQMEEALRELDHLAVYYDRQALAQDAEPARLDVRRIDVRRPTGAFHPKVILLLVDEPPDPETGAVHRSLIVGTLSANLTRAGWWENVETGHLEEIRDRERVAHPAYRKEPFRRDVLSLIQRIRKCAPDDEDHAGLEAIHTFLRERTITREPVNKAAANRWFTRLWCGQEPLPDFLHSLRLHPWDFNLEVISPFFDAHDVGTLQRVIEALRPREVRVYLPRDAEGVALVSEKQYAAVGKLATWAELPSEVIRRQSGASGQKLAPRRLHAKVYRLWSRDMNDVMLIGSPNLTQAAHSGHGGNLEAAFFVDATDAGWPRRWWLDPLEVEPERLEAREPEETVEESPLDLSLRYDWAEGDLAARADHGLSTEVTLHDPAGPLVARLERTASTSWVSLPPEAADRVRELLGHTSFLLVRHGEHRWRLLVREEGMAYKPSLLSRLTPEEILRYWSLLTAEQKAHFIEERLATGGTLEGLPVSRGNSLGSGDTFFDRFAGLFHAFGRLREAVSLALEEGRERDAEARLLGVKYDSLPVLLQRYLEAEGEGTDPVLRYVAFLCAKQLWDWVSTAYPDFEASHRAEAQELENLLSHVPRLRGTVGLESDRSAAEFLDWFEQQFLRWARLPEVAE